MLEATVEAARVLVVTAVPDTLSRIRDRLREDMEDVRLEPAGSLDDAIDLACREEFEVALLDVTGEGAPTVERVPDLVRLAPTVVLVGEGERDVGHRALDRGAVDFLEPREVDSGFLARSARYAREQSRTTRELEKRNQELQRFAHTLSHELRTPLNTVSVVLRLMEEELEGADELGEELGHARHAVGTMDRLVEGLLRYARVGGREIRHREVDTSALVDDVMRTLRDLLASANARVERGDLPVVRGDGALLEILFTNLVENAVKYRGADDPLVRIEPRESARTWTFDFVDNGRGIPPEHREQVFDVFTRAARGDERVGHGIGLATARRIAERHGGRLELVRPEDGVGSIFRLTLPRPRG
jgi:signal transduction histidine kinase